jgi:hypothetical protein
LEKIKAKVTEKVRKDARKVAGNGQKLTEKLPEKSLGKAEKLTKSCRKARETWCRNLPSARGGACGILWWHTWQL